MADIMPTGAVDTFTGSNGAAFNATNWATATNQGTGGSATIQGNQGRLTTGTTSGNRTSVRLLTATRLDQEVVFDWVVPAAGTMFAALWVRTPSAVDTASGYYITLEAANMDVGYGETTNAYNRTALSTYTHGFTAGQLVRTRFAVFGGTGTKTLKVRTWLASSQEPTGSWQVSLTDTHVVNTAGYIGLTNSSASAGSKNIFIDNFDAFDTETPTQKTVTLAGSIMPSGTLIKNMPKTFIGSITPSGALAVQRVVKRIFTGAITMSGVIKKVPQKALAGSITGVGTFIKVPRKMLAGSITPVGIFGKFGRKNFAGSIAPSGQVIITFIGRVFGVPGLVVVTIRKAGELRARFRRT